MQGLWVPRRSVRGAGVPAHTEVWVGASRLCEVRGEMWWMRSERFTPQRGHNPHDESPTGTIRSQSPNRRIRARASGEAEGGAATDVCDTRINGSEGRRRRVSGLACEGGGLFFVRSAYARVSLSLPHLPSPSRIKLHRKVPGHAWHSPGPGCHRTSAPLRLCPRVYCTVCVSPRRAAARAHAQRTDVHTALTCPTVAKREGRGRGEGMGLLRTHRTAVSVSFSYPSYYFERPLLQALMHGECFYLPRSQPWRPAHLPFHCLATSSTFRTVST